MSIVRKLENTEFIQALFICQSTQEYMVKKSLFQMALLYTARSLFNLIHLDGILDWLPLRIIQWYVLISCLQLILPRGWLFYSLCFTVIYLV